MVSPSHIMKFALAAILFLCKKHIHHVDASALTRRATNTRTNTRTRTNSNSSTDTCTDNSFYWFNNNPAQNCEWVKQNPDARCDLVDQHNHNIKIKKNCPRACNKCSTTKQSKQDIGQFCQYDHDCASWTCRENTCYASNECEAIKHLPGEEFHIDTILLVFVGSGFTDLYDWRTQVAKTFRAFNEFEFFDYSNSRYNAFFVDELVPESFCNFNCEGRETLLCCDVPRMRQLTKKCFPPGMQVNTIVIENSETYGGGGYRSANMATTSIHPSGPRVAVHELGHSLFELGDEYTSGLFTANESANCDNAGCPKWADLDQHVGGGLCEMRGCKNGEYYIPGATFMNYLYEPFGEVNTRYTCCTFLALTGGTPHYCDRFEFGEGLVEYCKNDYQGYGLPYERDDASRKESSGDTDTRGKYVLVSNPAILMLNVTAGTYTYETHVEGEGPKLFRRRKRFGDFPHLPAVVDSGIEAMMQLTIEFDSGLEHTRYYNPTESVDFPPNNGYDAGSIDSVEVELKLLEIVVDARNGVVVGIEFEHVEITWWFIIKTWLSELWKELKEMLFGKGPIVHETTHDVNLAPSI